MTKKNPETPAKLGLTTAQNTENPVEDTEVEIKTAEKPDLVLQGGRSRRRRNVVGGSPHREEYVRLMRGGWSSLSLERYAQHRYGEDIPSSTFRSYKARAKIESVSKFGGDADAQVDVLAARSDLIRLQQERIGIDLQHERSMGKLFGTTKGEIELLSRLLSEHKGDLQDVGVMPKAGDVLELVAVARETEEAPRDETLAEAFGVAEGDELALARVLHLQLGTDKRSV